MVREFERIRLECSEKMLFFPFEIEKKAMRIEIHVNTFL